MKYLLPILNIFLVLILLSSCAKPTKLEVIVPGDKKLDCEQLEMAFLDTRDFKKKAESYKDPGSGGNLTRTMLFWPALLQTIHNADEASRAADERGFHLVKIMNNKKCTKADKLAAELSKKATPVYYSLEIKRLHKLYKKKIITEEEFIEAKKKVLAK